MHAHTITLITMTAMMTAIASMVVIIAAIVINVIVYVCNNHHHHTKCVDLTLWAVGFAQAFIHKLIECWIQ